MQRCGGACEWGWFHKTLLGYTRDGLSRGNEVMGYRGVSLKGRKATPKLQEGAMYPGTLNDWEWRALESYWEILRSAGIVLGCFYFSGRLRGDPGTPRVSLELWGITGAPFKRRYLEAKTLGRTWLPVRRHLPGVWEGGGSLQKWGAS